MFGNACATFLMLAKWHGIMDDNVFEFEKVQEDSHSVLYTEWTKH